MPKIRRDLDNFINSLNKKLERFKVNFGTSSPQYQKLSAIVQSEFKNTGLVKNNGLLQIKRSYKVNGFNINWHQLGLDTGLINPDKKEEEKPFSTAKEKKAVRELVRQSRKSKGMSQEEVDKKVTAHELKTMAESTLQMDSDLTDALQFFYDYKEEEETKQALQILNRKGKRTYSEIAQALSLAKDLQGRLIEEKMLDSPILSYTIPENPNVKSRWDKLYQNLV